MTIIKKLCICILLLVLFSLNIGCTNVGATVRATHWGEEPMVILFMDVWASPPTDIWKVTKNWYWYEWWEEDLTPHFKTKVLPLLEYARANNIKVIFSTGGYELAPELNADLIIDSGTQLDNYLRDKGITTIYYAGYASNLCILGRDTGMRTMDYLGYNVILIEDCSLSVPKTSYSYEEAMDEINTKYGGTITFAELKQLIE